MDFNVKLIQWQFMFLRILLFDNGLHFSRHWLSRFVIGRLQRQCLINLWSFSLFCCSLFFRSFLQRDHKPLEGKGEKNEKFSSFSRKKLQINKSLPINKIERVRKKIEGDNLWHQFRRKLGSFLGKSWEQTNELKQPPAHCLISFLLLLH